MSQVSILLRQYKEFVGFKNNTSILSFSLHRSGSLNFYVHFERMKNVSCYTHPHTHTHTHTHTPENGHLAILNLDKARPNRSPEFSQVKVSAA